MTTFLQLIEFTTDDPRAVLAGSELATSPVGFRDLDVVEIRS